MPYLMHAKKAWLSIKTTLVIACPMLVSFYSYPNWGVANHLPPPPMQYVILKLSSISLPWWLGNPLFRHCDTLTCTIRYCNDSPHKRFHIVTIRPHRGRTVQPPPNRSVRPHRSGSKRWLWQSEPRTIRPILCSTRRGGGDSSDHDKQMALLKKRCCANWENFTHAWVSRAQAWPNITLNMARPTQQSSAWTQVNGVLLGGVNHTPG